MTNSKVQKTILEIVYADDDTDDRFIFNKALLEIPIATHLKMVNDGEELMIYLDKRSSLLPDLLFLDFRMPRKTGIECLIEIKKDERLKHIPVIMFSTSSRHDFDLEMSYVSDLARLGLLAYIRKPKNFELFKQVIQETIVKVQAKTPKVM